MSERGCTLQHARVQAIGHLGLDANYRDEPLRFQWQSPIVLVEALDLAPARTLAYGATRRMVLAEALLAAERETKVCHIAGARGSIPVVGDTGITPTPTPRFWRRLTISPQEDGS